MADRKRRNIKLTVRAEGSWDDFGKNIEALWLGKAWGAYKQNRAVVEDLMSSTAPQLMSKLRHEPPLRSYNPYQSMWDEFKIPAIKNMRHWEGRQKHYGWLGGSGKNAYPNERTHSYVEGWKQEYVNQDDIGTTERSISGIRVWNDVTDRSGEPYGASVGGQAVISSTPYGAINFKESGQYPWHKEQGWPNVGEVLALWFQSISNSWYDRMKQIIERSPRSVTTKPKNFGFVPNGAVSGDEGWQDTSYLSEYDPFDDDDVERWDIDLG